MKKYYLHDGSEQHGPYDLDDLKDKDIQRHTPVWYVGLSEWTTADQIEFLKDLVGKPTPPPFKGSHPYQTQPIVKKNSRIGVFLKILAVAGAIFIVTMVVKANIDDAEVEPHSNGQTYQEKVKTVEEIERSQPTKFLIADGKYNENIWGNKIKVNGIITNTATVALYKDAVVRVTYFTKTKTELGSKDYTIYEQFPPHSTVKFDLKIENYKDVNSIGWEVVQATAIN